MHYINILLSSVEYDTFVKLMRIMRPVAVARQRLMEKADAKGISSEEEGGGKSVSPAKSVPSSKDIGDGPSDSKKVSGEFSPSDAKRISASADDGKFSSK